MARRLYTLFFFLCLPLILLRLLYRAIKAPAYARRWAERFALGGDVRSGGIWVHAVSVGESIAAAPMVRELLKRYPALPITVTCMTPTGSEQIRKLFGGQVGHAYLPYDLPWLQRRLLRRLQPKIGIIMETELWPNLVAEAGRARVPLVLANARLSARSARGYQRVGALVRPMFAALDWVAVQSQAEALRFIELGVGREQMQVTGSIKFDFRPDPQQVQQAQELRARWGSDRPVWIAASTHAGEDEQVLRAHRQVLDTLPDALLILVPRHPERFDSVARQVSETGFGMVRRSSGALPAADQQVLVGDTMGELVFLYACADLAFVGGSLVPNGGHNYLEPAALGLPVLSGPHRFNFTEISELLEGAGALQVVADETALAVAVQQWLQDSPARQRAGQAGQAVVADNQGALERLLQGIDRLLH
ncbi:lipid IV(A) 3-deoxy-D-manno-octulosonic acid transferase [Halopseudomonas aestusnigri]|jgi:3-deoxy-D-manno-octulosonic-acid transferase|uniref:lipid IV(A) 3-deoxy-D-manno-octulosonic acid transferase n=1 Tax=Halopseudomonas TaxID=2901189 RepID=UPI000C4A2B99|nr:MULTISPECIES: lipid IV(A) 3-deoxy-D-manno-octulosonic acid transferase [Halopseudomonas]MAD27196.1 3-deoxy-D-manno-octulosonic acid transferase [Pseudomonadales bacterium]MEE2800185.1 lipid IV(A) 3-deoxy-D-manno-octulosonic acid transferase [Pseudomonadota bacterium]HBT56320.1 3-deoxy-D-manno-octulosonic acid transferase [Pseudomonas sp.]MAK75157.1 3-deoxy-D-manno-octulosonic acid transferase [Pseudomonadales bacterium]MAS66725.1 3-deoxy-D-manno-octulosonic acid transferase [Pseudomonadales|tara:strand:+ start:4003 stop:5265 length:1263 start_codon:yes stop_codon:yes gene_type:complete